VIMLRKRMFEEMETVAAGRDPLGTIRDPAVNDRVHLPIVGGLNQPASKDGPRPFLFLAGQPDEVRSELEQAWQQCAAAPGAG